LAVGLDLQEVDDVLDEFAVADFLALGRPPAQRLRQQTALHAQVAAGHDVVQHAHALEQRQVLERAGDAHLGGAARVHARVAPALEFNAALLRRIDAVDDVEHRALAGTVRADDGADLVFAHIERDVGQGLHAPERQRDVLQVEHDLADALVAVCLANGLRGPGGNGWEGLERADPQVGGDLADAAVLELELGHDVLGSLAREAGVDQHAVLLGDEGAPHLAGARELVVVRVQLLVQDQEAGDLRGGQLGVARQVGVDLLDTLAHQLVDLVLASQVGVAGVGQAAALGPVADGFEVDVDEGADVVAAGAEGHRFLDVREELELEIGRASWREGGAVWGVGV